MAYKEPPGGAGGAVSFSAGTSSAALGSIVFSNSGGVSFGLNGSTITASVGAAGGGLTNINISAGSTSNNLSALTFSNANGVSFGLNGSVITGTVATNYLTTARASTDAIGLNTAATNVTWTVNSAGLSLNASGYVGTPFATTTVAGSVVAATHNSAGVTLAVPAYLTTAQAPGAYLTTARASNDAVGLNTAQSNVTWTVNSSGLSLDARGYAGTAFTTTTQAGANITATHNSAGVTLAVPAYLTTAMLSNAATLSNINISAGTTSTNASAFTFNNANGVSFGLGTGASAGSITASHNGLTTARASTDAIGLNSAFTAGPLAMTINSSGLSLNAGSAAGTTSGFTGANISGSMTHNTAGLALSLSVAAPGGGGAVNFSAGTTSQNLQSVVFATGNGITFGIGTGASSQSITASHNGLTTARASNDGIGLNTAQTNVTWTANSAGLSLNAAGYAGTGTSATNASITMNSNGLAISVAAPGGGAGNTLSYYANMPVLQATQTMTMLQSTSGMFPFMVDENISFAFIRLLGSGSVLAASSTAVTTGNTSYTAGAYRSHNMVIYSRGAGASSNSLQYVTSTQNAEQYLATLSCAANSTQFSYSNRYTFFASNGQTNFTKDYSSSAASLNFHTSNLTDLTGLKVLDFPFAGSLSPGRYWLGYGISSTTSTGRTADQSRLGIAFTYIGASQATLPFGVLGAATNSSVQIQAPLGSFSTAGGGTTSSANMSVVSSSGSQNMLFFQLMRVT